MRHPFASRGPVGNDSSMLIDRYLPDCDRTVVRHVVVEADPETTYDAMLAADLTDTGPLVRALSRLRDVPTTLSRSLGGNPATPPLERLRFADVTETEEWTRLADRPGEEFVFGAVGTLWRPAIEWRRVGPEEFAAFDEPGYAKLAIGLSVRPYGERRTLLTYDARTATTSERARRNFRWYWRLVGPFAGYVMSRALERIAADAEAITRRSSKRERDRVGGRSSAFRRRLGAAVALVLAGTYHFVLRPLHRRWGTTDGEARAALPGDDLLPDATDQVTHAIEIDASAEAVWPWLVQLGQDRGGFYSYDWLENAVGADIHNADRIVPEYQDLVEGDIVRLAPEDYPGSSPESAPEVALLESGRALVLRPPGESPAWTWAFVLESVDEGTTRLLARMRSNPRRSTIGPFASVPALQRVANYLFWEPAHFVMERGMLRGIKRRAERMEHAEPSPRA
ncbi:hypothetical protein [Natrinema caseinilyticum]|uniref:hypothetical protein n=1 Tax=Natrinema caseinilyticum TaxID=2961570 RepID=UPI0020C41C54|nr:hypothetical protein [Natrinema caseinilyticum]